jgi:quinol monooxygenase YgiN
MHVRLWRFRARPDRVREFEDAYGPDGPWARLFRGDPAFLGSDLFRASDGRYLVLDRWGSEEAFLAFLDRQRAVYDALDARCAALTDEETPLGSVEV